MDFEKMDYNKQVSYVKGNIIIAIAEGRLDSFLGVWVDYLQRVGYKRGFKDGQKSKPSKGAK